MANERICVNDTATPDIFVVDHSACDRIPTPKQS